MKIGFTKTADKQIKALDENTRQRVIIGIEGIPRGDIKKLRGLTNGYRLRVGEYRVLFKLARELITITAVLPRGEAYKNL